MKPADLSFFRQWFTRYVAAYYGPDGSGPEAVHLKEDHTARTCREIILIGGNLQLQESDLMLAETTALFHDLGRFPQWKWYGTFLDSESEDHALLGLGELSRHRILDRLPAVESDLIREAVRHHNVKALPGDLEGRTRLFAGLLRDADKLDIWRLVIERREEPGHSAGESPKPERIVSASYSPGIVADLWKLKTPDLGKVRNRTDLQLLRLGWVYDLNFAATCREVLKRRYLNALFEDLPDTEEMRRLQDRLTTYLQRRLDKTGSGAPS